VTAWFDREDGDRYESLVFDGRTGVLLRTGLEDKEIGGTVMTPAGEILGKAGNNRIVRHDSETFERIDVLPAVPGGLDAVSVAADGRLLSAFSRNGTVSIYDLEAGLRVGDPIPVTTESTFSGMIRSDGEEIAVNVADGVAVWDLRPETHADAACRMAGRDLTREEWSSYLGDLSPYRSTCGFGAAGHKAEPAG
jgi:hypothetical protein